MELKFDQRCEINDKNRESPLNEVWSHVSQPVNVSSYQICIKTHFDENVLVSFIFPAPHLQHAHFPFSFFFETLSLFMHGKSMRFILARIYIQAYGFFLVLFLNHCGIIILRKYCSIMSLFSLSIPCRSIYRREYPSINLNKFSALSTHVLYL